MVRIFCSRSIGRCVYKAIFVFYSMSGCATLLTGMPDETSTSRPGGQSPENGFLSVPCLGGAGRRGAECFTGSGGRRCANQPARAGNQSGADESSRTGEERAQEKRRTGPSAAPD